MRRFEKDHFLAPVFATSTNLAEAHHVSHSQEYIMMGTVTVLIIGVIVYSINSFKKYSGEEGIATNGFVKLLEHKWYIDELYNTLIVNPLNSFAGFLKNIIEKRGI